MPQYLKYNTSTGEITAQISCPENMITTQLGTDEDYIDGAGNDATQYIDTSTNSITNKPDLSATLNKNTIQADTQDTAIISGLPIPTTVAVSGIGTYEVTDGDFEFSIDTPGEYQIKCSAFPYLTKEFVINAN